MYDEYQAKKMELTSTTFRLIVLALGIVLISVSIYQVRDIDTPGGAEFRRLLYIYQFIFFGTAFFWFVPSMAADGTLPSVFETEWMEIFIQMIMFVGFTLGAIFWIVFSVTYMGFEERLSHRWQYWLLLPVGVRFAVSMPLVVASLLWEQQRWDPPLEYLLTLHTLILPAFEILYGVLLMGAAMILLSRLFVDVEYLDKRIGFLFIFALIIPIVVLFPTITGPGSPVIEADVASVVIVGIACGSAPAIWALVTFYDPFEVPPALTSVGPRRVIDGVDEPVIVTDEDGNVVSVNPAARQIFQLSSDRVAGKPVMAVLSTEPAPIETIDHIECNTREGRRHFDVSVSPIENRVGSPVGYAMVMTDQTEQLQREQRLEVLNRFVRHNLRNEMTVIQARAELLDDRNNGSEHAEEIRIAAKNLTTLGEKSRTIERILDRSHERRTKLREITENVSEAIKKEFPLAEITIAVPDVEVAAEEHILHLVLYELLENACKHTADTDPVIEVRADRDTSRTRCIRLAIKDEGPGIPVEELAVIQNREITDLHHGTGIGLWIVRWGADRLSAELQFLKSANGGTIAVLDLFEIDDSAVSNERIETVVHHSENL